MHLHSNDKHDVRFRESNINQKSNILISFFIFIRIKIQSLLKHRVHGESLLDWGTQEVVVVHRFYWRKMNVNDFELGVLQPVERDFMCCFLFSLGVGLSLFLALLLPATFNTVCI